MVSISSRPQCVKHVLEIFSDDKPGSINRMWSIPWLLMTWWHKEPGHQKPWPWPWFPRMLWFHHQKGSGPRFNIKMSSYQYRKSHCGDKTVVRSSYLHNGISYTGKMASLHSISPRLLGWYPELFFIFILPKIEFYPRPTLGWRVMLWLNSSVHPSIRLSGCLSFSLPHSVGHTIACTSPIFGAVNSPIMNMGPIEFSANFCTFWGLWILSHKYYRLALSWVNSLWPSNVIWWQGSRSTLAQVMACCLTAPSHNLNQCWLMISEMLRHSPDSNFTENTSDIYCWDEFEIY